MFSLSFQHLHIYRIPVNYFFLKITIVAGKAGSSCSETKAGIFHNWFACSYAIKEISEMIQMIIVSLWLFKTYIRLSRPFLIVFRIFFVIRLLKSCLHCFWISKYSIVAAKAGCLWHNTMMNCKAAAFHIYHTFFTHQLNTLLSTGSTYKIYLESKLKSRMFRRFGIL